MGEKKQGWDLNIPALGRNKMRKMLEILPQVPCWKERVDQMTLLVGDAGLLSVVGTGVNHYTRGAAGFTCQVKTWPPSSRSKWRPRLWNVVRPEGKTCISVSSWNVVSESSWNVISESSWNVISESSWNVFNNTLLHQLLLVLCFIPHKTLSVWERAQNPPQIPSLTNSNTLLGR